MTRAYQFKRTLVLGTGPFAEALVAEINAKPQCGYRITGVVAEQDSRLEFCQGCPVLGTLQDLNDILPASRPDSIIVCLSDRLASLVDHQLVEAKVCRDIAVVDGKDIYEQCTGKLAIEALTPASLLYSREFQPSRRSQLASRIMSLVLSLVGLVLLAPLYLLIALAIKLDSRGPVLFVQDRVGKDGRRFKLLKFRSMRPTDKRPSEWEGDNTDRITRVGRWLRKFRLDELPQFINVIRGDMNLVGPRPHPSSNFELFVLVSRNTPECGGQIPYYTLRSKVRPGITGWAQVRYRYANNLNEEIEKLRFDLFYVKHYSFFLDLRILLETVRVVLFGHRSEDTPSRGTVIQATFGGVPMPAPRGGVSKYARGSQQ